MIGFALVCALMGPSQMLNLPLNLWLIISSFPIMGIFQVFVFIPIIPEMIERLQVKLEITEGRDEFLDAMLNDRCNDAYGLVYALSMFLSPLIGSALQTSYGQRATCDILMIGNLCVAVILLVFNCGPFVFQENRVFKGKLE